MPDMVSPEGIPPSVDANITYWPTQGVYNPCAIIEIIKLRNHGYPMTELHVCHRICKAMDEANVPAEPWNVPAIVARIRATLGDTQQQMILNYDKNVEGIIAKVRLAVPSSSIIHAKHCLSM